MASVTIKQISAEQTTLNDDDWFEIQEDAGTSKKVQFSTISSTILSGSMLDYLYPIGSVYAQFPAAESNTEATAFPTSDRPATKFGGTWSEILSDKDAFFKVGTTDHQTRTDGLSPDQFQGFWISPANESTKHLLVQNPNYSTGSGTSSSAYSLPAFATTAVGFDARVAIPSNDGTNGTPRKGTVTEPQNYRMKLWKRTA